MLHPENAEYGSSSQSIGHRIGFFFSGTIFISLNDPVFCQKWLGIDEPLWTMTNFLGFYCCFTLLVTLYVAVCVPERDPELERLFPTVKPDPEDEVTVGMTFNILKNVAVNKNVQVFFGFLILAKASSSVFAQVGTIYLTNDLGYSKENLSLVKVICTPVNIFFAGVSGYLSNQRPF